MQPVPSLTPGYRTGCTRPCRAWSARCGRCDRSLELEQPQRVVLEHRLAALVHHLVRESHQAALSLGRTPALDHLALDVDRIAHHRRPLDVERGIERGGRGVLHGRQQQAFGEGIHQRRGDCPALDGATAIVGYGEELLRKPRQVDEGRDIGLIDRAAVSAELEPDAELLERKAAPDELHPWLKRRRALPKALRMRRNAELAPFATSFHAPAEAWRSRE